MKKLFKILIPLLCISCHHQPTVAERWPDCAKFNVLYYQMQEENIKLRGETVKTLQNTTENDFRVFFISRKYQDEEYRPYHDEIQEEYQTRPHFLKNWSFIKFKALFVEWKENDSCPNVDNDNCTYKYTSVLEYYIMNYSKKDISKCHEIKCLSTRLHFKSGNRYNDIWSCSGDWQMENITYIHYLQNLEQQNLSLEDLRLNP